MAHFEDPQLLKPNEFNFAKDVIDFWASKQPDAQAMYWVSGDLTKSRKLSFTHFQRQSHRVAIFLSRLGIRPGERVVMILPRVPQWWEIAVAAIRAGIVICPASTLLVDKDIEFRCTETGATAFIGNLASVWKFRQVWKHCPTVRNIIQVDEDAPVSEMESSIIDFKSALQDVDANARHEDPSVSSTDPALIYFTSGTTGPPKMVQHNHISYPLAHTLTGKHWLQLSPGKLYWNLSEQGWAKAAWSFFGTWNCGASLFIHDDRGAFSPTRLLNILHQFPITTLCAPPTAYRQLVLQENQKYLQGYPPQALSHCTGAGEPLNAGVIMQWQEMTGVQIFDGYGQTETILVRGNFPWCPIRPGSMGKPTPGVPLTIVSPNGSECEPGVEGDIAILVGGDSKETSGLFFGLFDGYLSRVGKLDRSVKRLGSKSWYLTGDRAFKDEDGYFWFVGRADDVINSAGHRIGPFEVESTLKLHPRVVESAVIASPDPARGEVVKALVVLTEEFRLQNSADAIVKELQDFCKQNAAPYKYPRKIQIVEESYLPKTISGKIKRKELRALEWLKAEKSKL